MKKEWPRYKLVDKGRKYLYCATLSKKLNLTTLTRTPAGVWKDWISSAANRVSFLNSLYRPAQSWCFEIQPDAKGNGKTAKPDDGLHILMCP